MAFNENGELIAQGKAFEEEIVMVDLALNKPLDLNIIEREEKIYNALVLGVKDYFKKTNHLLVKKQLKFLVMAQNFQNYHLI